MITVRIKKDTLTPLLKGAAGLRSGDRSGMLQGIGLAVVAIAQRSFNEPGLRQVPWPAKKDGSASNLKDKGVLVESIRVISVGTDSVRIGSDREYAAIHQFGGRTKAHVITPRNKKALSFQIGGKRILAAKVTHPGSVMPARPFFPITKAGRLTPAAARDVREVALKHLRKALG